MVFEALFSSTVQPIDPADSPRDFHYTQSPAKQHILQVSLSIFTKSCQNETTNCERSERYACCLVRNNYNKICRLSFVSQFY
jgi:hypothetical protein